MSKSINGNLEPAILERCPYFCFLILLLVASMKTHAELRGSWDMVESQHFLIYYHAHATSAQDIVDIAEYIMR